MLHPICFRRPEVKQWHGIFAENRNGAAVFGNRGCAIKLVAFDHNNCSFK